MLGTNSKINVKFSENVFLIIGRSGSGKTFLMSSLVQLSGYPMDKVIIISPHFSRQPTVVQDRLKGCAIVNHDYEQADYSSVTNTLLIFDDCAMSLKRNTSFIHMCLNKRHVNNCVFILAQTVIHVPVVLRSNYEYLFLFKYDDLDQIDFLYRKFFSTYFKNKHTFRGYLNRLTGHAVILENHSQIVKVVVKT